MLIEAASEPCDVANDALKYAYIGIVCFGFILAIVAIKKRGNAPIRKKLQRLGGTKEPSARVLREFTQKKISGAFSISKNRAVRIVA